MLLHYFYSPIQHVRASNCKSNEILFCHNGRKVCYVRMNTRKVLDIQYPPAHLIPKLGQLGRQAFDQVLGHLELGLQTPQLDLLALALVRRQRLGPQPREPLQISILQKFI